MIYKGEIIECPRCRLQVGRFRRDMKRGDWLKAEYLEPLQMPIKDGDQMVCKECREPYFNGQFHIKGAGWVG